MANPTPGFITAYNTEVHNAYEQGASKLRGMVRTMTGVRGSTAVFQKASGGTATTKARNGYIPPMNITRSTATATLADYHAGDFVDDLDLLRTNVNERQVVAGAGARALGRKTDDLITTAASGTTTFVGDYSTGFTKTLALQAFETLNTNDVPDDGRRFGVLAPHAWNEALNITQFASADYVGMNELPWLKGTQAKRWLNITWIMHTNLPLASTDDRDCYLFHADAIGLAIAQDVTTRMDFVPERDSWFINSKMSMGAVLIDAEGVVEIRVDDDATIS